MRSWMVMIVFSFTLPTATTVMADCTGGPNCGCHVQCPNCRCYCKLTVDKEKEKDYCWNVQCEPICVPKVRFPWESCCKPKCAHIKYVHVLKKEEFECEHCKYKWEPVCVPCATCQHGGCANGGCVSNGCADSYVPLPAAPAMRSDEAPQPPPVTSRQGSGSYWNDESISMNPMSVRNSLLQGSASAR